MHGGKSCQDICGRNHYVVNVIARRYVGLLHVLAVHMEGFDISPHDSELSCAV